LGTGALFGPFELKDCHAIEPGDIPVEPLVFSRNRLVSGIRNWIKACWAPADKQPRWEVVGE